MCIRDSRSSAFLAGAQTASGMRRFSEDTAQKIDLEVKRIIDEAIEAVRNTLVVRKKALEALTQRLIEVESVDSAELKTLIDENSPGPLLVPGTDVNYRKPIEERESASDDQDRNAAQ